MTTNTQPGSPSWRLDQANRLLDFGRGCELPGAGFGWLDEQGRVDPSMPRPLFLTARMTYVFALASVAGDNGGAHAPGATAHPFDARRAAEGGYAAMSTRFADTRSGGWFASVDASGTVDDRTKANYAHAHVLLAAATGVAIGIAGAEELLAQVTAVIDEHFWSDDEQAAVDIWDDTFSTLEPYRGANSNMHSVEAYLVAGDVTGNPVWHSRALHIAGRIINEHARRLTWRIPEHYDAAWRPVLDYNSDHRDDRFRPFGTTPGHSFEWARLLVGLQTRLNDPPPWLIEAAVGLYDAAARLGWAPDGTPGFVYTLDLDGTPVVRQRLHWVVCEAVLAADTVHRHTGDSKFADDADRWWQHIADHFLDDRSGGWWQELDPSLRPSATIWPGKPDLYHSYQALLLPSLPLAPSAAVALVAQPPRWNLSQ